MAGELKVKKAAEKNAGGELRSIKIGNAIILFNAPNLLDDIKKIEQMVMDGKGRLAPTGYVAK